ncbi:hypothetical protein M407DRAFT_241715 [Tulasnella calospora MUT 4182]|uniref:Fibronectin type-III domain-containing protein n=1 Tax=Tulasnella calospora MUT 4182 TaxID=1051891 RepID=A0A0C3LCG3_9AGAM|nr:hypothetical protein M407DRAFT_241715 [Tulasnella calospora MUT 4182]
MQLSSFFIAIVVAVGIFAQTPAVPDPSINTPTGVIQCQPVQLTCSGTQPPFVITIVPGGEANAAPLETVGTTSENAVTWMADLPTNTNYTLLIRDGMGRTAASAPFVIFPGTDSACVKSNSAAASPAPAK